MVDGEPAHLASRLTGREIILLVAGETGHEETLHVVGSTPAVLIDYVVDSALVVALEYVDMDDSLTDKHLLLHLDHFIAAILIEDNYIVDRRAVAEVFILFK